MPVNEEEVDKHVTTIEWETDAERVRVIIRVERFPKEETAKTNTA